MDNIGLCRRRRQSGSTIDGDLAGVSADPRIRPAICNRKLGLTRRAFIGCLEFFLVGCLQKSMSKTTVPKTTDTLARRQCCRQMSAPPDIAKFPFASTNSLEQRFPNRH
jgi:hypothetical protein